MPLTITDLPYHLLVDHLLPLLPTRELLALKCTSKYFSEVCSDTIFWKRRLQTDFNFSTSDDTARTSGFNMLYKGMHNPKVYVWGESSRGRLGVDPGSLDDSNSVPFPRELKLNFRIVSMVSGGWSFHALDDTGAIYVWGTLHAETHCRSTPEDPSFCEPAAPAWTPTKLQLPTRFLAISCARRHSAALDAKRRVWMFNQWGRPNLLTFTGSLNTATRHPRIAHAKVIQVECGWGFTSFLMDDGRVFIIWPASGMFAAHEAIQNKELDEEGDGHPCKAEGGVIQCIPMENSAEPLMLPGLPSLPHLRFNIDDEGSDLPAKKPPKLVKIAAGECFILGLTDQGHVVCIDVQGGDEDEGIDHLRAIFTNGVQGWTYLPEYCDIREVVKDPVYAPGENGKPQVLPPKTLRITHISAHFNYFVTYSPGTSSTVLMSFVKREAAAPIESITRTIHPTLQNQDIISVVLGDYHFGALHGDGTLYTWGRYSNGALGLGDPTKLPLGAPGGYSTAEARNEARQRKVIGDIPPPDVEVPSPVRFDWDEPERNRFCFAVAAFGWQMGALVIDLDDSPDDENESLPEKEEKETRHGIEKRSKPSVKSNSIKESGWEKWKRLACGCFGN